MLENLSEMLITHHVGGRWRAPLSQRMRDVPGRHGTPQVRLVEAEAPDIRRALVCARAAGAVLTDMAAPDRAALATRFLAAYTARRDWIEAARRREGFSGGQAPRTLTLPGTGPIALLGSVVAPPGLVAGALAAALRAGRPLLLKPAPRAPFTALVLAEALAAADPPPGTFALLQGGGGATGAALRTLCGAPNMALLGKPARSALSGIPVLA